MATKKSKTRHPSYATWTGIKQRCYNKNEIGYRLYGGRGIVVCDRWLESFWNFAEDMGNRPEGMSIDRIDSSKGYTPENCRWATSKEQNNNTRRNRYVSISGITKTLSQWIDESGLKPSTVRQRYYVYNWSAERSLGMEGK